MSALDSAIQEAERLELQVENSQRRMQATRNQAHALEEQLRTIQQQLDTTKQQLEIDEHNVEADLHKLEAARARIRLEEQRMGGSSYHLEPSTTSTPARVSGFTNHMPELNEIAERAAKGFRTDDLVVILQDRTEGKSTGHRVVKYMRRAPEDAPEDVRGRLFCDDL
ncbi:hypothetical protein NW752_006904 [Fusarium irregulare]|uniref:Uncharacterized protein n=1 Tax=Fusarium irregulare TaxID=2494466 RepID=A0A9W8PRM2_9HYPO|nr:hypothetical protein NW766_005784 [Fusarium irregulare]KAJ4015971.1 hypothetical protein NW752_006904 [Fusarium irregulare]